MATTKTKSNTNEQKRKDTIFDKNIENQNIYTTTQNIDINIPIIEEKKKKVQTNVNNKNKIALVTDSSNSITPADAKKLDITILNFSVTRTKGPEIEVFEDQTNDKTLSEIFINIAQVQFLLALLKMNLKDFLKKMNMFYFYQFQKVYLINLNN